MNKTRSRLAAMAGVCVLGVLAGCGDAADPEAEDSPPASSPEPSEPESSEPAPETSEPAEEVVITIEGFEYTDPGPVPAGTEITVENLDDAAHTVTAEGDGGFDITIAPGETGTFAAPDEAGEYPYVCTFHAGMTGTLVVE